MILKYLNREKRAVSIVNTKKYFGKIEICKGPWPSVAQLVGVISVYSPHPPPTHTGEWGDTECASPASPGGLSAIGKTQADPYYCS